MKPSFPAAFGPGFFPGIKTTKRMKFTLEITSVCVGYVLCPETLVEWFVENRSRFTPSGFRARNP